MNPVTCIHCIKQLRLTKNSWE